MIMHRNHESFSPEGLGVATKTIERFVARAVQLYKQEQEEPFGSRLLDRLDGNMEPEP